MTSSSLRLVATATVMTVVWIAGCGAKDTGPATFKVTGKITFDSKPLETGEIIIRSEDGKHAAGSVITNGAYELRATEGRKIVEISALRDVPGKFKEENPGEKVPVREQMIPAKYNKSSTLKIDVTATDTSDVNFDLAK